MICITSALMRCSECGVRYSHIHVHYPYIDLEGLVDLCVRNLAIDSVVITTHELCYTPCSLDMYLKHMIHLIHIQAPDISDICFMFCLITLGAKVSSINNYTNILTPVDSRSIVEWLSESDSSLSKYSHLHNHDKL